MEGVIKKIVVDRGFGFIKGDDGKDVFFHLSGCTTSFDSLKPDDRVTFNVTQGPKGPRAEKVLLLD
jgi:CspA family cold shock protein